MRETGIVTNYAPSGAISSDGASQKREDWTMKRLATTTGGAWGYLALGLLFSAAIPMAAAWAQTPTAQAFGISVSTPTTSSTSALAVLKANVTTLKVDDRAAIHRLDGLRFAERLHPGQYDVAFADPPYAGELAARLVALFRVTPFARILSIEHAADQPIPGDDTRRYGDTVITFLYAP